MKSLLTIFQSDYAPLILGGVCIVIAALLFIVLIRRAMKQAKEDGESNQPNPTGNQPKPTIDWFDEYAYKN